MNRQINGLLFFALFQSCTKTSDCKNQLMATINGDDNKQGLVLFARDCGATTSTSIHLSIHNKGVNLDEAETGNIFIADGSPTLESYKEAVLARWVSEDVVEVQLSLPRLVSQF